MENASKALLMAAGILIGILIISLMVVLFISSTSVNKEYEQTKQSEVVQQFNVNFTKFVGKNLTIHDVVTICNFAKSNNVEIINGKTSEDIEKEKKENFKRAYKISLEYDNEGYVTRINFN